VEHQEEMARYDELRRRHAELEALLAEARQADEARFQAEWQEYQQHLAAKAELEQEVVTGRQSDSAEFLQAQADHEQLVARQRQLEQAVLLAREADAADYRRAVAEWQRQMAERAAAEAEVEAARKGDEWHFQLVWQQFVEAERTWKENHALAEAVLAGERDAYAHVLRELSPFQEISSLGSRLDFHLHPPKLIEVGVKVNGEQAIPSRITSLTASGKVSVKAMPKARFHEIYQDHVCGCVLRIGREVLALLPVDTVLVTATADVADSRTGQTTEQPILSVAMPRGVMQTLNFTDSRRGAPLDPSDAMDNFLHRGDFRASRRSGAFVPIVPLRPEDLTAAVPGQPGSAATAAPFNPFAAKWAESLRRNEIEFGFLRLTANELAAMLGRPAQDNFTLPESKALAREVERYGYCLEPDPRHGAGNFWGNREVGLFQPPSGAVQAPSEQFQGAAALLQLCLLVAAADGSVDRGELDQFRQFIESQFQFTPDEHQRLIVLETLMARNAASAKVTLGRTAKRVPQGKHIVIAQFLVDVAAVDGVISPKEHKAMARIFEALGLSEDTLETLIRNLPDTGREVVIQSAEPARPGEPIPAPGRRDFATPFKLDMARVAAISAETHEVIGLLAKAMAEDESTEPAPRLFGESEAVTTPVKEVAPSPPFTNPAPQPTALVPVEAFIAATASTGAAFDSLDVKYRAVAVRLVIRDTWSRADFEALAREHQLMPLSVFDAINEWADQQLGDFLLEGEATIIIHRNLLTS
jgi:tellurite resistance protein